MNSLRATALAFTLAAFTTALSAAPIPPLPTVTDLGLLPGDTGIGAAGANQITCSAARGGDDVLVVWMDERSELIGGGTQQSGMDIFGMRLDAQGVPLDPVPFAISAAAGWQQSPQVIWNGENWLVTFYSQDPTEFYYQNNMRGVRVSPAGEILDPTPLLLVSNQQFVRVGGQAGQWLITWADYHEDGYGSFINGRRLANDGTWLDAAPTMLVDWTYPANSSRVLAANGEYLVLGQDWFSYDFKAIRVGLNGQPIGSFYVPIGPDIGTNGSEFLVTWIPNGTTNLLCSLMTANGTLLNPAGATLYSGSLTPLDVTITHDGTNWFVGWGVSNKMRVGRVNASGTVLDRNGVLMPVGTPASQNTYGFQVVGRASGGAQTFYYDYRTAGDANVFSIPVSAGNVPGSESVVSTSTTSQRTPSFALGPNGQITLALLSESTGDDRVLVYMLDAFGQPTSLEPIEVAAGAAFGKPGIAWNGSNYLVVWNDASVKARRLNPDGTFVDPAPIDVMPGFNVDVAALGADFCVTASNAPGNPQFVAVYYRRVSGVTGALLDPGPVLFGGSYSLNARIHAADGHWIATWEAHSTHDDPQAFLKYVFIESNGTHTSEVSVAYSGGQPDVAFDGSKYLFVWRNNSLANANNYIAGRVMNPNGTFATATFVIAEASGRQLRPVVGWDGATFVVAWDDQRNQIAFFDERTDIYGARVSGAGTVLDPTGFPVVKSPNADAIAAIVSRLDGVSFVASARFELAPPFDSYRVGVTTLKPPTQLGDINGDGAVNATDLGLLLGAWGTDDAAADLNVDGIVDAADLAVLLGAWS